MDETSRPTERYENASLVDIIRTEWPTKFIFGELMRDPNLHDTLRVGATKLRG